VEPLEELRQEGFVFEHLVSTRWVAYLLREMRTLDCHQRFKSLRRVE
jgi:hypothetical protein